MNMYSEGKKEENVSRVIQQKSNIREGIAQFKDNRDDSLSLFKTLQCRDNEEEESLQRAKKTNKTGLPDNFKTGVEHPSGFFREILQLKRVNGTATIVTIGKLNSSKKKNHSQINVVGYSRTHRLGVPNEQIENRLTREAKKNKESRTLLHENYGVDVISSQPVEDRMNRRAPANGWGNCAEPHAVYNAVVGLSPNQFITEFYMDRAITIDNGYHNDHEDERCANCIQWCPVNAKHSIKLPCDNK
ncbi:MAG: hypothetical protein IK005_12065 [Paludibacteraceae bacterium]|nr:hypothetical protein [Paludibacteraceae bacterium]MBR4841192.1 hypothetical protein [Paludibacteraceae bacterium]